jgi:hypothetical protein
MFIGYVTRAPFQHQGKAQTAEAGEKLVNNGWYLGVRFYERTPPYSDDTYQLSAQEMLIDAEGVIFSSSSLLLEPVRPERVLRARPGHSVAGSSTALVKLVAAVDMIADIEASLKALYMMKSIIILMLIII